MYDDGIVFDEVVEDVKDAGDALEEDATLLSLWLTVVLSVADDFVAEVVMLPVDDPEAPEDEPDRVMAVVGYNPLPVPDTDDAALDNFPEEDSGPLLDVPGLLAE